MTVAAVSEVVPTEASDRVEPHRARIRTSLDIFRLIASFGLVVAGVGMANVFDSALLGLSQDSTTSLEGLPPWVRQAPGAALAATVVSFVVGAPVWALVTTRFRRLVALLAGSLCAAAASVAVGEVIYVLVDEPVRAVFDLATDGWRYRLAGDRVRPGDPVLAAAVAVIGISASWLRRSVTYRLALLILGYVVMVSLIGGLPMLGLVSDIGLGLSSTFGMLLVFGRHDLTPTTDEIRAALRSTGIAFRDLGPAQDGPLGSNLLGTTTSDQAVTVKALGRDERSADLMVRAYRWIRFRKTADHRPFVSLRRAVEHEALISLQAGALGVRTPRLLGVTDAGVDGMVLATEAIDGQPADAAEGLDDEALAAIWTMVNVLHSKGIAHRDLRLANVILDHDGEPWLVEFGFSELAASDQQLGTDVAELLGSTAAVVGADRAVRVANETAGVAALSRALPWLQPLALSASTREALGGDGIRKLRDLVVEYGQIPAEEPAKLQRIDGKTLFVAATVALSAWFLLPQLADVDNIWAQVRSASIGWALIAVAFSILTYAAATASLLGAIPYRLKFWPAFAAQLASSFANRVTPARVGGLATNIRYFQRNGIPTAVSVTAVGLNAIAGLIMHLLLTLTFLLLSGGSSDAGGLVVPSPATVGIGLGIAMGVIVVSVAVPFTRGVLAQHVVPQLEAGWESMQQIGRSVGRLMLLFGGSAAITLAYLVAMAASLTAFGSDAAFPLVGLLYLTGSVVANAAPTPGGLGAAEAALVAAFSLIEDAAIVIPAVFLFRFVTFWLPILPGWVALTFLRNRELL